MSKNRTAPFAGRHRLAIDLWSAAAVLGMAWTQSAHAQQVTRPDVSFNAAVTSDYVFRGVSQTLEEPALQLGADVSRDRLYAGAWDSTVDFGDGQTDAEIDLYAGVRPQFAGLNWDMGVIGYLYTDQPEGADYSFAELKVGASRAVGQGTLGATIFYSPDYFGATEDEATYAEINGSYPVHPRLTLSAAVGQQWLSSDLDYAAWNLGAAWQATDHLVLDVRYHDTDAHDLGRTYDSRVVFSLKAVM